MYGALSENVRIEQTVHRLGAVIGSSISGVHTEDFGARRRGLALVGDVGVEDYVQLADAYATRWNGQNLWMERSIAGFQTQGYQIGDHVVTERELKQSPYYRHFLRPLDIRHGVGIQIWQGDSLDMAVASFHRGHRDHAFDAEDVVVIEALRPHLANAYAIYRRIAKLEAQVESLRAAFSRAPLGMLVMDHNGRVLESNDKAEADLFAMNLARIGADRRLLFRDLAVRKAFEAALYRLVPANALPTTLVVQPAGGSSAPLALHLCRVPAASIAGFDGRASVLAFVAAPDRAHHRRWSLSVVRSALGLTPAEARVALALLEHVDVAATAGALGLSVQTVRSHIKAIHSRLGIQRTADLLRMLDRLLGAFPADEP
jgi:DNA-binding CsgD family transcriptional regulator/PAS domain-containing protein